MRWHEYTHWRKQGWEICGDDNLEKHHHEHTQSHTKSCYATVSTNDFSPESETTKPM